MDWQGGVCGKQQCVFFPQGCWEWVDNVCVCVGWRLCVFDLGFVCGMMLFSQLSKPSWYSLSKVLYLKYAEDPVLQNRSTGSVQSNSWAQGCELASASWEKQFDTCMNVSWYSLRLHFHIKVAVSCTFLLCIHKQISMTKNGNWPSSVSKSISDWSLHQSD